MLGCRESWIAGVLVAAWLPSLVQAQASTAPEPVAAPAAPAASIAGLQPDQRPEGAPRVTRTAADAALKQQRLAGIARPWPGNVERIAEQGAWYSPMFHPGMTSPYDLRALHGDRRP